MAIQLINVGYGNFISADKVIAVVDADSAPVKRAVLEAKKKGNLVDATVGHKTRTVLVMESGHLVLSAKATETVAANCTVFESRRKAPDATDAARPRKSAAPVSGLEETN